MTTLSSILAWEIPWMEKPGGLYSTWGLEELDTTEHLNNNIGDGVEVVNQERVLGYLSMQTHISPFVWHQAHHWPLMA